MRWGLHVKQHTAKTAMVLPNSVRLRWLSAFCPDKELVQLPARVPVDSSWFQDVAEVLVRAPPVPVWVSWFWGFLIILALIRVPMQVPRLVPKRGGFQSRIPLWNLILGPRCEL